MTTYFAPFSNASFVNVLASKFSPFNAKKMQLVSIFLVSVETLEQFKNSECNELIVVMRMLLCETKIKKSPFNRKGFLKYFV